MKTCNERKDGPSGVLCAKALYGDAHSHFSGIQCYLTRSLEAGKQSSMLTFKLRTFMRQQQAELESLLWDFGGPTSQDRVCGGDRCSKPQLLELGTPGALAPQIEAHGASHF